MSTAMDPPPLEELVSSKATRPLEEIYNNSISKNCLVTPSQPSSVSLQSDAFQMEESIQVSTMKTSMAPPPPLESSDPIISSTTESPSHTQSGAERVSNLDSSETSATSPSISDTQISSSSQRHDASETDKKHGRMEVTQEKLQSSIPYRIPEWSEPPCYPFYVEVLKEGSIIDQLNICEKGAYMFGRADLCDFVLEHPTISRFHAVIQFRRSSGSYLYDLGSTHGTFVNKREIKKRDYVELHVGSIIRFGLSTRLYIFQGPADLMQPEGDLNSIRSSKARQEMDDREASLSRARREACLADGISWGMQEDAVVEAEDIASELTWQTYKGYLTEKQEKTREKVIKRYEKIANMKKEIDAIRAKDIAQGGLTQGQQTQIARNEQRISQIMEELENLEETLNDSIRESVGARSGKTSGAKKAGPMEEEEEFLSDDDEFYDRAKKLSVRKNAESHSIETADTLLDKQDDITREIEEKKQLLLVENCRIESETENKAETDELDQFMSAVSSQIELDKIRRLENEVSTLQSELDRIIYLLKFADPAGESAKRRLSSVKGSSPSVHVQNSHAVEAESHSSQLNVEKPLLAKSESPRKGKERISETKPNDPKQQIPITTTETKAKPMIEKVATVGTSSIYTLPKPQWLGAVASNTMVELSHRQEPSSQIEHDNFIDYKDRKKILDEADKSQQIVVSTLENAAPGLIIRKKIQAEGTDRTDGRDAGEATIPEAQTSAEDAVALLLKHKRGLCGLDDGDEFNESVLSGHPSDKRAKKIHGPAKPSFMEVESEYESWVPPKGQTGDGRTSLNERYGY